MIKWFISPKGEKFLVKDCLEKGLLSDWYPLPYLHMCADERPWTGIPSTTQLINGVRLEYLRIFTPYALDPADQAFRIIGSRAHHTLDKLTPKGSFSELSIPEEEITGISDLLEQQPDGSWWISDYKVCGSYKVLQALGLEKKKRPAFDENGEPIVYKKSGAWGKAGDQKMEDYFEPNPSMINIPEWELQVNRYRIVAEKYFGIEIPEMRIFMIVRDGGTVTATGRGVYGQTYYVKVRRLDDDHVNLYFQEKREKLCGALKAYSDEIAGKTIEGEYDYAALKENLPSLCTDEERWGGKRCREYCAVRHICAWLGNPDLADLRDQMVENKKQGKEAF